MGVEAALETCGEGGAGPGAHATPLRIRNELHESHRSGGVEPCGRSEGASLSEVVSQPESAFTTRILGHETANFGDEANSIDRPGT